MAFSGVYRGACSWVSDSRTKFGFFLNFFLPFLFNDLIKAYEFALFDFSLS